MPQRSLLAYAASLTMPQRSLLAYAGITQARLIPQLEVAANRVVDVGGVYFFR